MDRTDVPEIPETHPASLTYRAATAGVVFGLPALLLQAMRKRWLMATPINCVIFAVTYLASGFGITVGYHRLFTHKSLETTLLIRRIFAIFGSSAIQGSPVDWVAEHHKHHAYADEAGDPHSPHVDHKGGLFRGFIHAHYGWLFNKERASRERFAPYLLKDPDIMEIHRRFPQIVLASYVVPFAGGLIVTRKLRGGLGALLWGGVLRIFFVHHATWSVNSLSHMYGQRRFQTKDESRNNLLVVLFGLGEGWHHNHHAFPRSAWHGLGNWLDPSWWLILALEKSGLAWDVVRITPDEIEKKKAELELIAA